MSDELAARVHALIAQWRGMWVRGFGASNSLRELGANESASYERGKAEGHRLDADALEAALAAAFAPNSEKE